MLRKKSCKESSFGSEFNPEDWNIVNNSSDGSNHYAVKLWGGAGYMLEPFSVWADNEMEALTLVAEFCEKNMPGLIIRAEDVFKEIEDGVVKIIEEDPEKYGFTEGDMDNLSNKKIISDLKENNRELYWKLCDQSERDNYIDEWAFSTENPDIYLYSENLWIDKWPDDYPSLEEDEEIEESLRYRKEASVQGEAEEYQANNIALVAQHNRPYAKQIDSLADSLLKKDTKGQSIDANKLINSSILDSMVRDIIRELKREDEDGDYQNVSTATKKLAKEYIADVILTRLKDKKDWMGR